MSAGKIEQVARAICAARVRSTGCSALNACGMVLDWQEYVDIAWPLYVGDARAAILAMNEPTEPMWGELARDIVFWCRFPKHDGAALHSHLKSIGRVIPDWLSTEIPNTSQVPPKGTVAACIWKAMNAAALTDVVST